MIFTSLLLAVAMQYAPPAAYEMEHNAEIALARSAAPASISAHATVEVLSSGGYVVAEKGSNGFTCVVLRGFAAPTYAPASFRNLVYVPSVRAPICFDPRASQMVLPYYNLRAKLALEGKTPDEIAHAVQGAYDTGSLPKREGVSFGYMWSEHQNLGPGVGHWHPHVMVFAPYYTSSLIGNTIFGSEMPQTTDDPGTPFAVIVIPVDMKLFVK